MDNLEFNKAAAAVLTVGIVFMVSGVIASMVVKPHPLHHTVLKIETGGAGPYALPSDHPGLALAEDVLREVTGVAPIRVRMGATVPIGEIFKRVLGLDTVFFSFATSDEDYHAPNEFFRLASFETGLKAWRLYLQRLGA